MKKITMTTCVIIALFLCLPAVNYAAPQNCDKAGAKKLMAKMRPQMVQSVTTDAGWVIVTFGQDYFNWTDRQTEGLVTTYANLDACITGQARSLEFRSPSGKLIARADSFRGIQMK
ncbi:MAG: hypothetical protein WAW31_13320 [Smithella sp.]